MIIILEGPDGAGKSTLASKLASQTGYDVVHMSMPKTEEDGRNMFDMYKQAIKESDNVIFDRCWYSEMVYGPVMRGKSWISHQHMYELEKMLEAKGALIIYCTNNPYALWEICHKRGEDYVTTFGEFRQIYTGYTFLMECDHVIPVVKYMYRTHAVLTDEDKKV